MHTSQVFCGEKVQAVIRVLHHPNRSLGKYDRPLKRRTVKMLTLSAVTVLCIQRISVELKCNISAPTLRSIFRFKQVSFALPLIRRLVHVVLFIRAPILAWNRRLPPPAGIWDGFMCSRISVGVILRRRMRNIRVRTLVNWCVGVGIWFDMGRGHDTECTVCCEKIYDSRSFRCAIKSLSGVVHGS